MPTYNLDAPNSTALVQETTKIRAALRYERHYNVKNVAGLVVGDTVYADIPLPDWVRTVCISKRTDTANADTVTAQCQDAGLPIAPVLPIKTASAVQTTGSTSNAASNTIMMQLYPIGNIIRVQLTLATSVPNQCLLSIELYDF